MKPPAIPTETVAPATSWKPIDLAGVGETVEEAVYLTRSDGVGLLYPGRVHWFQGESESHKTWIVLIGIAQALIDGHNCAYIDFEDHPATIKARLIALGVPEEVVNDPARFAYIRPDEPLGDDQTADLMATVDTLQPAIVAIDGVSESMTLEGLNPLDTPDTAEWIRRLPKRITASGAAVPVIDHQTKATDNRRGWAFGSQHKKAGTDGAAYDIAAIRKLHRAYLGDPVEGVIAVRVAKDRPGYVRGHSPGDLAATVKLTAWPDGGITYTVTTDAIARDHELRVKIAQFLDGAPGSTKTAIRDVGGKGQLIDQTVAGMIADGMVRMEQKGSKHAHYLTDKGRSTYLGDEDQ